MHHLVLMRDGETVAEAHVASHDADAYAAAFPQPYVPQEYPKWVERDGAQVLVHGPEEEAQAAAEPAESAETA